MGTTPSREEKNANWRLKYRGWRTGKSSGSDSRSKAADSFGDIPGGISNVASEEIETRPVSASCNALLDPDANISGVNKSSLPVEIPSPNKTVGENELNVVAEEGATVHEAAVIGRATDGAQPRRPAEAWGHELSMTPPQQTRPFAAPLAETGDCGGKACGIGGGSDDVGAGAGAAASRLKLGSAIPARVLDKIGGGSDDGGAGAVAAASRLKLGSALPVRVLNESRKAAGEEGGGTITRGAESAPRIPKSMSTGNLQAMRRAFPTFERKPSPGRKQMNLKDAVVDELCKVVTTEMVGDHYAATSSGQVLNHLYLPVFNSVKKHLRRMPKRYSLSVTPMEVTIHLRMLAEVQRSQEVVSLHVSPASGEDGHPLHGHYVVAVAGKDRKCFLDVITRPLNARGEILDADIVTTKDGYVLDRFTVRIEEGVALAVEALKAEIREKLEATPISPVNLMYPRAAQRHNIGGSGSEASGSGKVGAVSTNDKMPPQESVANDVDWLQQSFLPPAASPLPDSVPEEEESVAVSVAPKIAANEPLRAKGIASCREGQTGKDSPPLTPPTADWEVEISEIKLEAVIGKGRSGKMHRARWRNKLVAAKVIDLQSINASGADQAEGVLTEFYREINIISKLRHPNICLFLGASVKAPHFVTIFELLEGGSLCQYIRNKKTRYSFFRVAVDIAHGMAYLHNSRVIHRDLKSDNLLLSKAGVVKVADFGLSCFVGKRAELTAETGTYRWMAPEVIAHRPYGYAADIYSFAIVLWELLTRQQPFEGMTPIQAAFAVARQQMRPKLPTYVPANLSALIRRSWAQEPRARPSFEARAVVDAEAPLRLFARLVLGRRLALP